MSSGEFQFTTFEQTSAPLRLPLCQENRQPRRKSTNGTIDAQADGHREGYTTLIRSFDVVRDPCTGNHYAGIIVRATKNSHSVSYERDR